MLALQVEPGRWAKYLQLHFLSQYGTEPVCAINDIVVHGKSAAEDLEDQLSFDEGGPDPAPAAALLPPILADDPAAAAGSRCSCRRACQRC